MRYDMSHADGIAGAGEDGAAYYELGLIEASGRGASPSLVAAHKWLNIAVAKGFAAAAERRAELALEMTAAEIVSAQREARAFLTRH